MEQRRPRQRLRAHGSPTPQKTLLKFFMAIFTSFNPKTLYISTFSHVAASSTSTPSSPSQSWPSGWHTLAGAGDGSEGDPQVDPPPQPLTHTQTHSHKQTHPRLQGFAINPKAGEDNKRGGTRWRKDDAVEMQKSGTGYRNKSDIKTKAHTSPISYQSNLWYHSFCSSFWSKANE